MKFLTKTDGLIASEQITKIKSGEVSEYLVKITFDEEKSPEKYSIIWDEEQIDMLGFWSSYSGLQHNITPDWLMRTAHSRTASGMPLISLYNKANTNRLTISLSDPANPTSISAGIVEETGCVRIKIDLFSQLCSAIKEYEVILRIDRRAIPFYECVRDTREWWSTLGYESTPVPEAAKLPMYSTWYGFHQSTIPEDIIKECKLAKEYGMDTVIVDDG